MKREQHPTSTSPMISEERYAKVTKALLRTPKVTAGSGKKGFGASALQINNKIFAMRSSKGAFVVKLPQRRVEELIASGKGERFDPGHGRLMKEWFVAGSASEENLLALAREAMQFVGLQR